MRTTTPQNILDEVGEDRIRARLYSWENFYQVISLGWSDHIELNLRLLRHCVESYYCDLYRSKTFHRIDYADQHKRAAYTIKWISKLRPIQLSNQANNTTALFLMNDYYALYAGAQHLNAPVDRISPTYLRNLIYTIHNRQFDGMVLSSQMYLLECALNQKQP